MVSSGLFPKMICHRPRGSRAAGFSLHGHPRGLKPAARWVLFRFVVAVCLLGLVPVTRAPADQIVANGANYRGASVVALEGGQLQFRSADGRMQSAWIDEIELLIVERGGIFDDARPRILQRGRERQRPGKRILGI